MEQKDKYVRFDWAIKRLLRNKGLPSIKPVASL